jgi:thiol-disulfide isomerase/thioredoxin
MSPLHALVVLAAAFGGEPAGEVIDFSATYCGPCRSMTPIVARLEREGLPIRQVDIERDRALADKFHITKIPTFVLVINGTEATRIVGPTSEAELRRMCSRIPQPFVAQNDAPTVQLASNPSHSRAGVSQPLGTAAPAEEKKPNKFLEMLGVKQGRGKTDVRANNEEIPAAAAAAAPAAVATNDPMAASVRIRASINGQISLGSGTVVHSEPGRTFIVTCGHIFRNMNDSSKIEVDLFEGGKPQTYVASIKDFDLEADVGLISIPTHSVVSSTPLAPPTLVLEKAAMVACIGCSGGNDPTREQLTITAVNKYDGPDNIECTGTPVQGRSGGGLFANNQLVGVCIAAVTDEPLGVYAHVFAVHKLLDRNDLAHLYQPAAPAVTAAAGAVVADAGDAAPADFPAEFNPEPVAAEPAVTLDANTVAVATTTPTAEPTDLAAAMSDVSAGDAEVVVIIRSRSKPNAESRVVIINRASPKFLAYLNGENRPEGLAAGRPAPASQAASTPKSRDQLAATARGPQSVAAQMQPVSFQPAKPSSQQRTDDRSLTRRITEARRFTATAAK